MEVGPRSCSDIPSWVDSQIQNHKVCVFSKRECPYCKKAVEAFQSLRSTDVHVEYIENHPLMNEIQEYLKKKTGGRSVPRVFIGGKFIGGGDDTVRALADGSLAKKLREIGSIS